VTELSQKDYFDSNLAKAHAVERYVGNLTALETGADIEYKTGRDDYDFDVLYKPLSETQDKITKHRVEVKYHATPYKYFVYEYMHAETFYPDCFLKSPSHKWVDVLSLTTAQWAQSMGLHNKVVILRHDTFALRHKIGQMLINPEHVSAGHIKTTVGAHYGYKKLLFQVDTRYALTAWKDNIWQVVPADVFYSVAGIARPEVK